jgi:hypothetical protein
VSLLYLGTLVGARKHEGNLPSRMPCPKSPRTPFTRRPAALAIVVIVVMSPAPPVVVSARAVLITVVAVVSITVVVDTRSPSRSLNGVLGVTVGPEMTLDCRSCGSGSSSAPWPRCRRGDVF